MTVLAVVGAGHAVAAVLLQPGVTGRAGAAGIHHAPHTDHIAFLEGFDLRPDRRHPADNLVTRNHRVLGDAPVVVGEMDVGVAHAAVIDLDGDVIRAWRPALNAVRRQA